MEHPLRINSKGKFFIQNNLFNKKALREISVLINSWELKQTHIFMNDGNELKTEFWGTRTQGILETTPLYEFTVMK